MKRQWRKRTSAGLGAIFLAVIGLGDDCHLTSPSNHDVTVGPGFSDVGPHQLVRTTAGLLYTVAATCKFFPGCGSTNTILVHKADAIGTPSSFSAVGDSADVGVQIGAVAIAIDGQDRIHALWVQRDGFVHYGIFDTATDSWGGVEAIEATNWTDFGQGDQGVGLALDPDGVPFAVWSYRPSAGAPLRAHFSRRLLAGWETPIDVADAVDCDPPSADCAAWHPTVAFKPNGDFLVAWESGTLPYERDGWVHVRTRTSAGTWLGSERMPEQTLGGLDDGPSMMVTGDGVVHVAFVGITLYPRYYYRDAFGWHGDRQPPEMVTHDPSLGPDGAGGVNMYAHGPPPPGDPAGEGNDIFVASRPRGGGFDATWTLYSSGPYDSSVSTRWAQFFHVQPWNLDILYWSHHAPNELHLGVN